MALLYISIDSIATAQGSTLCSESKASVKYLTDKYKAIQKLVQYAK